jgi:hypothetical protein
MATDGDVDWRALLPRLEGLQERLDYIEKYLVDLGQAAGYRYAPFSTGLPAEVAELAQAGKTLEAVKLYRQLTNANFEQARTAVAKAAGAGGV